MTVRFGGTDKRDEAKPPDHARAIEVAASDVAACLWTVSYARLCAGGLPRDMRTARDRGITIIVLRFPDSPDPPAGLFPASTRVAVLTGDPADGARIIQRIHDHGFDDLPLLSPSEGTK